ncbi:thiamine phosphate synthase [Periweissella ghanensis]|uniref:Thiamine-phosphate synthase n=1 Tax=Periweissella ghanensis TaxID=467997 RepID=A0ABM8Z9W5_9LACO|nr:thiamine phosphate synthase [Periweissella ghanensis]MCM0600392.1 thiamine phosphate synthase [Periweissella ghanensis]CAH0418144.1 Thiamine-phosphate synthase [Periweissella ghanensis]
MQFEAKMLRSYLVIGTQDLLAGQDLLALVEATLKAGVTIVQYREKGSAAIQNAADKLALAQKLKDLTTKYQVPLVIDDDVDLALAVGADGIHVGQSDQKMQQVVAKIKASAHPETFVGLSVSNLTQLANSDLTGVSYLGSGPIKATSSKADADPVIGLAGLTALVQATELPIVAIGGVSFTDDTVIAATGAHGLAMISAFTHAKDSELNTWVPKINQAFSK